MDVKDQILFDHEIDGAFGPSPMNVNIDRVRHRGIELGFQLDPLPWLELHANYTLDDTQIQQDSDHAISTASGCRSRRCTGATPACASSCRIGSSSAPRRRVIGSRYVANDLRNEFEKLPAFARRTTPA